MTPLLAFLLGIYLTLSVGTFFLVSFFVMLGGKQSDLWKPFVYGLLSPISLPLMFIGILE